MQFIFKPTKLPEVMQIKPTVVPDNRGSFTKIFNTEEFLINGINQTFVEDSVSVSKKNVLRGFHYQLAPHVEGKLVIVLKGKAFDVVVDIRRGAPNFGRWVSAILYGKNCDMLWVPPGFAHGFISMQNNTHVMYKMSAHYFSDKQRGIIWNDSKLGIKWPITTPILSKRDSEFPTLDKAELNFDLKSLSWHQS